MFKQKFMTLSVALAIVAAAALLLAAVSTGDVEAARGGKGGGKGHGGTTPAPTVTLTVSPNPVPLGSTGITITGSGFGASEVTLDVSGWFPSVLVTPNAGSFSVFYSHSYSVGGWNSFVKAYVGGTLVATAPYTVCSTNPC